jgi:hypothetical protein
METTSDTALELTMAFVEDSDDESVEGEFVDVVENLSPRASE